MKRQFTVYATTEITAAARWMPFGNSSAKRNQASLGAWPSGAFLALDTSDYGYGACATNKDELFEFLETATLDDPAAQANVAKYKILYKLSGNDWRSFRGNVDKKKLKKSLGINLK